MRRLLTLAVVGSWLVMLALLVERQAPPPRIPASPLPAAAGAPGDREEWFTVQRDGQRVGWAHRVTGPSETGVRMTEDMVVALAMLGTPQRLRTSLVAETDASQQRSGASASPSSRPAATFSAAGDERRPASPGAATAPPATTTRSTLPLNEPIALPSTLRPRVLAGDRTPGTRYTAPVFSPLTLQNEPLTIVVEGRETRHGPRRPGRRARHRRGAPGPPRPRLDRRRRQRAARGGDARLHARARTTSARRSRGDSSARAGRPRGRARGSRSRDASRDPRDAPRLALRVSGEAAARVPDDPPRQRRAADRPAHRARGAARGCAAAGAPPTRRVAPYRRRRRSSSPTTRRSSPRARAIVGDARDPVAAAAAPASPGCTDHVDAGADRDRAERARGARARGAATATSTPCCWPRSRAPPASRRASSPARCTPTTASTTTPGTSSGSARWVSADAVFDQLPADATHVKLVEGGPERHLELAGGHRPARVRDRGGPVVIRIDRLRKTYGPIVAVDDLSLEVARRRACSASSGRNGAGKTTTIRMMIGLLEPTAGTVLLGGHDIRARARGREGHHRLPRPTTRSSTTSSPAREFLRFVGGLYGVAARELARRERRRCSTSFELARARRRADRDVLARHEAAPGARRGAHPSAAHPRPRRADGRARSRRAPLELRRLLRRARRRRASRSSSRPTASPSPRSSATGSASSTAGRLVALGTPATSCARARGRRAQRPAPSAASLEDGLPRPHRHGRRQRVTRDLRRSSRPRLLAARNACAPRAAPSRSLTALLTAPSSGRAASCSSTRTLGYFQTITATSGRS